MIALEGNWTVYQAGRGWIGVALFEPNAFGRLSPKGALVSGVEVDSPAAKAGIKAGDRITSFDGKEVDKTTPIKDLVAENARRQEHGARYTAELGKSKVASRRWQATWLA
jgi:S1-C subfamily serine protease